MASCKQSHHRCFTTVTYNQRINGTTNAFQKLRVTNERYQYRVNVNETINQSVKTESIRGFHVGNQKKGRPVLWQQRSIVRSKLEIDFESSRSNAI